MTNETDRMILKDVCGYVVTNRFLPDNVDTTLVIVYSCTTSAVYSDLQYQLGSLERHVCVTDALFLCGSRA